MEKKATCQTIRLHQADNVVVALADLQAGTLITQEDILTRGFIAAGHKISTQHIQPDEAIRKYGQIIGFSSRKILPGDHVHVHNISALPFSREYEFGCDVKPPKNLPESEQAFFNGIKRRDDKVGTRNYIGILPTVNCSASVGRAIAEEINRSDLLSDFPHIDGIFAPVHSNGCGLADGSDDLTILERTLAGYINHPNFGGILLIGLGCEVCQLSPLIENYQLQYRPNFQKLSIQEAGGTRSAIEAGIASIKALLPDANNINRQPVTAAQINLAVQCGGSDAYSGISANPALGVAADLIVQQGGTVILSETPEIFGALHLLTRRAVNRHSGQKLVELSDWWIDYLKRHGQNMDKNLAPGNREGGLTNILDKSLGATAKGGSTNLVGVYQYAEPITAKGLCFMDSPGYDPCSVTGQIASGANVICFTTGRGSVFGSKPAPTIKLAAANNIYHNMHDDMDLNCGPVIDGSASIQEIGEKIFHRILEVASGEKTKSELLGFGDNEFVPWHTGAVP